MNRSLSPLFAAAGLWCAFVTELWLGTAVSPGIPLTLLCGLAWSTAATPAVGAGLAGIAGLLHAAAAGVPPGVSVAAAVLAAAGLSHLFAGHPAARRFAAAGIAAPALAWGVAAFDAAGPVAPPDWRAVAASLSVALLMAGVAGLVAGEREYVGEH